MGQSLLHKFYVILIKPLAEIHPLIYAITIGAFIRIFFVLGSSFPLGDGGLFFTMTENLIANKFTLPFFTTYNYLNIPYAYPPLSFYLVGIIHTVTTIDLFPLFRFIPIIFSILTIPLFYGIAKELLGQKYATVSVFLFATAPKSFEFQILGGGITRSVGFFLALSTLYSFLLFKERTRTFYSIFTGVLLGLTLMTHLEWAVFAVISLGVIHATANKKISLMNIFMLLASAGIISSPWWGTLFLNQGIFVFTGFANSGLKTNISTSFSMLLSLYFTDEPLITFQLISILSILGITVSIFRYKWIVVWFLIPIFFTPRSALNIIVVQTCLMGGIAINEALRPSLSKFIKHINVVFFCIYVLYVALLVSSLLNLTPNRFNSVTKADREAFLWIQQNTETADEFLVVPDIRARDWGKDAISEWFPALTKRKSILTPQGREALSYENFLRTVIAYGDVKYCKDIGISCIEEVMLGSDLNYNYVYVPKKQIFLADQLKHKEEYDLVYDKDDVTIFKKI